MKGIHWIDLKGKIKVVGECTQLLQKLPVTKERVSFLTQLFRLNPLTLATQKVYEETMCISKHLSHKYLPF